MDRHFERYPATVYHRSPDLHDWEAWAMQEMGILKEWCTSLTRLMARCEEDKQEQIRDIIKELQKLIRALGTFMQNTTAYIKKNGSYIEANNAANAALYSALLSLEKWVNEIFDYIYPILDCIENKLYEWDGTISSQFTYIDEQIENLWEAVEMLLAQTTTTRTLSFGSDYSFEFFNGFYRDTSPTDTAYVTRAQTRLATPAGDFVQNSLNWTFGGWHPLRNDYEYTSGSDDGKCPLFSHGSSGVTQSEVATLLVHDSHFTAIDTFQEGGAAENIFNVTPRSARASWTVGFGHSLVTSGGYHGVKLNLRTIADGFNQQYYYYIAQGYASSLSFGSCSVDVTFTYSYMDS